MNEPQAWDVLLAKAIESAPKATTWVSSTQQRAASEAALASAPRPASEGRSREWAEQFLARRARHLLGQALPRHPGLQALQAMGTPWAGWAWAWPLLALCAGALTEHLFSPDRIHLLSPALLLVLGWNWVLMTALLVRQALRLRRLLGSPVLATAPAPLPRPGQEARGLWPQWLPRPGWSGPGGLAAALAPVSHALRRDWHRVARPLTASRWAARLHTGSALFALGLVASLGWKGLFAEYRVGWESAWLDAAQLQQVLATLGSWVGSPAFSLETITQLNGWQEAAAPGVGTAWFWLVTRLLLLTVVLPRGVLAALAAWRARRLAQQLAPDLTEPYYVALLATFGGARTHLQVWPYSYTLGESAQAALTRAARALHGEAATLALLPHTPYGQLPTAAPTATPPAAPGPAPASGHPVALFSLAATPETEAHGQFVRHLQAQRPPGAGALELWLDRAPLARKLGPQGSARLAEREALWRDFAARHQAQLHLIDLDT